MDHEQLAQLNKRNILVFSLIWGCLLLGVAVNLSHPPIPKSLLLIAFPIIAVGTVLTWKKWLVSYLKYFASIGISVICYFFMEATGHPVNMIIMIVGLSIISLYFDYKPLIFKGIICFSILNYFIFTNENYVEVDPYGVNVFFLIIITILSTQSILGNKMNHSIRAKMLEAERAQNEVSHVLTAVTESVEVLTETSSTLAHNTKSTEQISEEVNRSFQEIASGIEQQAKSASDIADAMKNLDDAIATSNQASTEMKIMSEQSDKMTSEGMEAIIKLDHKMSDVLTVVNDSAAIMQQMNEENQRIEEIVSIIVNIADQTNLLSLNASIEAARAGEHGQGFAVVSNEIRKLAQSSQAASAEIAEILRQTQQNIEKVSGLVTGVQDNVKTSKEETEDVTSLLSHIQQNTNAVLQHAEKTYHMSNDMTKASAIVLEEVTSVALITEQSSASVQQVLSSSDIQQQHMKTAVENVEELHKLTERLSALINKTA